MMTFYLELEYVAGFRFDCHRQPLICSYCLGHGPLL